MSKLSTPEEKAQWQANKKLGSRFMTSTPSHAYRPQAKAPSRRDRHRAQVAERLSK